MSGPRIWVLLVPPSRLEPLRFKRIGSDVASISAELDHADIDVVQSKRPGSPQDWHAYHDDGGNRKALPTNYRATALARRLGWPIGDVLLGPVVFLGNGPKGTEADVPGHVVEAARKSGYLVDQSELLGEIDAE